MTNDKKRFLCKEDGFNIYESIDEYGRVHFYAYLNRKLTAHRAFYIKNRDEKQMCIRFFVDQFAKRKAFQMTLTRT